METMEHILNAMPDVHIIHYFRDPRAIGMSVTKVPIISFAAKSTEDILLTELSVLCKKMEGDIRTREALEKKYPGAFTTLKYENLVTDPEKAIAKIYSHIGRKVPQSLWKFIRTALNNPNATEHQFGNIRRNATATARAWRKKFPQKDVVKAHEMCKTVLSQMGYLTDE